MNQNFRKIDGKALYDILKYNCTMDKIYFEVGNITNNWINWKTIDKNENMNVDKNRIFIHHRIQDRVLKLYTKIPLNYIDKLKSQGIQLEDSRTSGGFSVFKTIYNIESEEDIDKAKYVVGLALKINNNN